MRSSYSLYTYVLFRYEQLEPLLAGNDSDVLLLHTSYGSVGVTGSQENYGVPGEFRGPLRIGSIRFSWVSENPVILQGPLILLVPSRSSGTPSLRQSPRYPSIISARISPWFAWSLAGRRKSGRNESACQTVSASCKRKPEYEISETAATTILFVQVFDRNKKVQEKPWLMDDLTHSALSCISQHFWKRRGTQVQSTFDSRETQKWIWRIWLFSLFFLKITIKIFFFFLLLIGNRNSMLLRKR